MYIHSRIEGGGREKRVREGEESQGGRRESGREKRVREGEVSQGGRRESGRREYGERERGEGVERLYIKLSLDVFNMN